MPSLKRGQGEGQLVEAMAQFINDQEGSGDSPVLPGADRPAESRYRLTQRVEQREVPSRVGSRRQCLDPLGECRAFLAVLGLLSIDRAHRTIVGRGRQHCAGGWSAAPRTDAVSQRRT